MCLTYDLASEQPRQRFLSEHYGYDNYAHKTTLPPLMYTHFLLLELKCIVRHEDTLYFPVQFINDQHENKIGMSYMCLSGKLNECAMSLTHRRPHATRSIFVAIPQIASLSV